MAADTKKTIGGRGPKGDFRWQLAVWLPVLTVLAAIGYAVAAWLFLIAPKISPLMPGGSYDFTSLKRTIADDGAYIAKVDTALSSYQAIPEEYRSKVRHMVPENPDFPELMAQMEEIAAGRGMVMNVIEMTAQEGKGNTSGLTAYRLVVSFSGGNYVDYKKLLNDLQGLERLVDVTQSGYSPGMESYQVTMQTYQMPSAAAAVKK